MNFSESIKFHQAAFGVDLSDEKIAALEKYYDLIKEHNDILHLVAPCEAEEFATRHILESLTALEYLPEDAIFADLGSGAGLPGIPCLIVRDDLRGYLIEAKLKKSNFLQEAIEKCGLEGRGIIINRQFEEIDCPNASYLLCRALDKFTQKLPKILDWAHGCQFLFFSGNALRDELNRNFIKFDEKLMPLSEQRYLFISK